MTYRLDRTKKKKKYLNAALVFVAFSLFIYFWPEFKAKAYPIAEPVIQAYAVAKKGASYLFPQTVSTYFVSKKSLADKNKELEISIERLENAIASKDAFIREQIKASSSGAGDAGARVVILYPLAEDITKLYSTVLLSKGYRDGIEEGGVVYVRGMQGVCNIIEVYDNTSLCELFSKGNRITEGVTGSTSISLTLIGEGGGSFIAELPKDVSITLGEDVFMKNDQTYKLGTVIAIFDDEQTTGSTIFVRGAYNPVHSSVFYMNTRYAP